MSNASGASMAPRLVAQPSPATLDSGAATAGPEAAHNEPYVTDMEITPSWVAESHSSMAVAAYVVLAAMLTTFIGGIYAIVMLVRALS